MTTRIPNSSTCFLFHVAIASAALFTLASTVHGQRPAQTPPGQRQAFEVVSIRPSKPGTRMMTMWATTPDGYRVTGQSLRDTVLMAYFPGGMAYWSNDRIANAPAWLGDQYDIDAKVSDADLAAWQKQGLTLDKKVMLQQMLQSLLADRLHLVAHMAPGPPLSGWSLEIGKHAPHLTESKPGATLPVGFMLPDGGVMVSRGGGQPSTFYNATMAGLASYLSLNSFRHPVQDHTNLTGHYDFVVNWADDPDSKMPPGSIDSNDPDPLSHWNIDALGLHLTLIKIPVSTLVIDHIDKPSDN